MTEEIEAIAKQLVVGHKRVGLGPRGLAALTVAA
jgi:hypothetical protein